MVHSLFNVIFTATLQGGYVYSVFADEETETHRGCITCPRPLGSKIKI